jgi:hypothetical protein
MHFELVSDVECLFISQTTHLLLFFFVNDIVMLYDRRYLLEMKVFQTRLFQRFEMRCLSELK